MGIPDNLTYVAAPMHPISHAFGAMQTNKKLNRETLVSFQYKKYIKKGATTWLRKVSMPELNKYQPHFEKISLHIKDRLRATMHEYRNHPQPGYNVLCHADYHSRNMMFKHNRETGCLEDCMLLDYQGCNVAPMAVDLMYSIYMLMGPAQRRDELETLLNYYLSVLQETLKKIGYQGSMPTPQGFWAEMKRHRYYEFLLLSTFLPVSNGLRIHKFDVADMLHNEEARLKLYQLEDFVEETKSVLARFEKSGYFDDL
ncbi:uncharacterized protein LOC120451584 isoform X2 [Drosophila santomea]|uniref:uncharacterized protein LOC120451584 isoform X2 n=1 Tax=Drosophila santomea TaxID=129105 RepID=UPI0019533155|nr:uncharacterized protein LOC120451584 isoform X2 [Drosophila santomea]